MPKVKKAAATSSRKGPMTKERNSRAPSASADSKTDSWESVSSDAESDSESENGERPTRYLFHCALVTSDDPMITRVLSVPSTLTFTKMHLVMQAAFGWSDSHLWQFEAFPIKGKRKERFDPVLSFHQDPTDLATDVPAREALYKDAAEWKLSDVFENDQYRGKVKLIYEYDMGDSWEHQMTFLGVEDRGVRSTFAPGSRPDQILCVSGEGHPCAEDCGSAPGWEDLKEAFAKPRSRGSGDLRNWYKTVCLNGDPKGLDPYAWSILDVNDNLELIKA